MSSYRFLRPPVSPISAPRPLVSRRVRAGGTLAAIAAVVWLAGCGRPASPESTAGRTLTVWAHHGKPEEWATIQDQVRRFNRAETGFQVTLVEIAEGNYDTQVQAAAASRELPDVLEFDGPMLANYAWKGYLQPIGDRLDPTLRADLLPSIIEQGTYDGRLFAVATFDSGLGLYGNRALLRAVDARIPGGPGDAWSIAEFNDLLERLADRKAGAGENRAVLDLKRDYRGEWWIYGFYPILLSAGTDVIDRSDYQSAEGWLNSPKAVQALTPFQRWFRDGLVDPNTDGRAFVDARAALSWVGHWEYPRYHEALGDDLLLLPLPDFGTGSKTAMGSWAWAVTRRCRDSDAAIRFLEYLLRPEEILAMTRANGAVPARHAAVEESPLYRSGGPLRLFADQLGGNAVPRPRTPAYPVISSAVQEAILDIVEGAPVQEELDRAARTIDRDIRDNEGYPPPRTN